MDSFRIPSDFLRENLSLSVIVTGVSDDSNEFLNTDRVLPLWSHHTVLFNTETKESSRTGNNFHQLTLILYVATSTP